MTDLFSPAQCVGYLAFVFGVCSFLQRRDHSFKLLMAAECVAYFVHFALLGNATATCSSAVSTLRSVLSMYTRSRWVIFLVLALNLSLGAAYADDWLAWLPLAASCIGTLALFLLTGLAMRALMMCGSVLWLMNNIVSGSVGGTALEAVIIVVNMYTMMRMAQQGRARA